MSLVGDVYSDRGWLRFGSAFLVQEGGFYCFVYKVFGVTV